MVGSGPCLVPEAVTTEYDCIVAANGGAGLARRFARDPDVIVTTSHLFRDGDKPMSEQQTILQMNGVTCQHLWIDSKNGPAGEAASKCVTNGMAFRRMMDVHPAIRSQIVREATGGKDLWVSSGVWAVCLCVASSAKSVHVTGICTTGGHFDLNDDSVRMHGEADWHVLRHLVSNEEVTVW